MENFKQLVAAVVRTTHYLLPTAVSRGEPGSLFTHVFFLCPLLGLQRITTAHEHQPGW